MGITSPTVPSTRSGALDSGQGITEVSDGSSFIQAVRLDGSKMPAGEHDLTSSQSEGTKSKHYADQTSFFSKKGWSLDRSAPTSRKSPGLKVKRFGGERGRKSRVLSGIG